MVKVEGRCTQLMSSSLHTYINIWLTQKYSEFWLVRYNGLVCSNIAVLNFYHPIHMILELFFWKIFYQHLFAKLTKHSHSWHWWTHLWPLEYCRPGIVWWSHLAGSKHWGQHPASVSGEEQSHVTWEHVALPSRHVHTLHPSNHSEPLLYCSDSRTQSKRILLHNCSAIMSWKMTSVFVIGGKMLNAF